MICPCQKLQKNPKLYADCCEPLHLGQGANNCEKLMRSRYSAFVLGLTQYIKNTWHKSTCPTDLQLEADDQWLRLDVLTTSKKQVHFQAFFKDEHQHFCMLDEISDFVFENNSWLYVSGDTQVKPAKLERNDMCLCGSGKKFKKCCDLTPS